MRDQSQTWEDELTELYQRLIYRYSTLVAILVINCLVIRHTGGSSTVRLILISPSAILIGLIQKANLGLIRRIDALEYQLGFPSRARNRLVRAWRVISTADHSDHEDYEQ